MDKVYSYTGMVLDGFGNCIETSWHGETIAGSMKQAISQLKYRYREECNLPKHAKLQLPGTVEEV